MYRSFLRCCGSLAGSWPELAVGWGAHCQGGGSLFLAASVAVARSCIRFSFYSWVLREWGVRASSGATGLWVPTIAGDPACTPQSCGGWGQDGGHSPSALAPGLLGNLFLVLSYKT